VAEILERTTLPKLIHGYADDYVYYCYYYYEFADGANDHDDGNILGL
jgi:hypothetical protein